MAARSTRTRLPLNFARYLFLDPHSRGFFLDWDVVADDAVGALRMQVGRDVGDRGLSDLIGELSTAARNSPPGGPGRTSVCTAPPANASTTGSSGTSS